VPAAPTNLTATLADYDRIRLNWNTLPASTTSVIIERSTSPNSGFAQIAQVTSVNEPYVDMGLSEQTTYYYRIRAVNSAGQSPNSNVASATTPEVVISVRPQLAEVGLTTYAAGKTLYLKNNWPESTHLEWTIYALNGKVYQRETTQVAGYQQSTHSLEQIASGIYIVQILVKGQVFNTKICLP
jgi:titin